LPIADSVKKQIAQKRRLFFQVCLRCGARNPLQATRCRKCHASVLRLKNRSVGLKK
jgi:ubiquitin-large subunit ribosomal protein L40e